MGTKMYVGGLPYSTTDAELSALFVPYGTVDSAKVITDKTTGQSRGFGFVEMNLASDAESAIAALNSTELGGRTLIVDAARTSPGRTTSYGDRNGRNY